jgi:hypothetical protein
MLLMRPVHQTTELSVGGFYDIVGRVADATTLTQVIALPMGQEMGASHTVAVRPQMFIVL